MPSVYWCPNCGKDLTPHANNCPFRHITFSGTREGSLDGYHRDQERYREARNKRFKANLYDYAFVGVLAIATLIVIGISTYGVYLAYRNYDSIIGLVLFACSLTIER